MGVRKFEDPEIRNKLILAVRMGNKIESACQFAGISIGALRTWLIKGEAADAKEPEEVTEEELPYLEFYRELAEAEAMFEMSAVQSWASAFPDDWKAAKDFLARRFPKKWGSGVEAEQTNTDQEIIALLESLDLNAIESEQPSLPRAIDASSDIVLSEEEFIELPDDQADNQ